MLQSHRAHGMREVINLPDKRIVSCGVITVLQT